MQTHETPFGTYTLAASECGLTRCSTRPSARPAPAEVPTAAGEWLGLARHELDEYFAGRLHSFSVPVDLSRVREDQRRILEALGDVGHGQTTTYGELAAKLGLVEDGPRQVGGALARNPVWLVVPCHRVLGAGGKLVGYAGGLEMKRALLDLEACDRAALALW